MATAIYRGLTESDLDFLIDYAYECDLSGFYGLDDATDAAVDRVFVAAKQLRCERVEAPDEQQQ